MHEIKLPQISEEHDESSVIMWFKQVGDHVAHGEALAEVQTEKAVSQIEADKEGILEKINIARGEAAQVGDVLCVINTDMTSSEAGDTTPEVDGASQDSPEKVSEQTFVRIAPRLRRLAKELNVDLTKVSGTGRNAKITEEDIQNAAEGASSDGHTGQALSGTRRIIADRMMGSLQNSAQLTETAFADVTKLAETRQEHTTKLSWTTWIITAVIKALQEHPYMNGIFTDELLQQDPNINLGIAADTEDGLLVPVIKAAPEYSLDNLDEKIKSLAELARERKLSTEQMSGGTFTITSLGGYGIRFFTPIINPPEIAILGIGAIENFLFRQDGDIHDGQRLPLSLTFDHQVVDGAPAAAFLKTLINKLENPEEM